MNYVFIVLLLYLVYFAGMFVYDAFIYKPALKVVGDTEEGVVIMEDTDAHEVHLVTEDTIDTLSNAEIVDEEDLTEMEDEELISAMKKNQEAETYADVAPEQPLQTNTEENSDSHEEGGEEQFQGLANVNEFLVETFSKMEQLPFKEEIVSEKPNDEDITIDYAENIQVYAAVPLVQETKLKPQFF